MNESRLIALSGTPEWYEARRRGVSATAVARAATPAGFAAEVESMLYPEETPDNDFMRFGRDWEQWIVDNLPPKFDIRHNNWLIHAEGHKWQMATPDGLSENWHTIAEVKTTGTDWDGKAIPIQYRRQVQWQMYVTGAQRCVFAWLLRVTDHQGDFAPGWFTPKWEMIHRDDDMIAELVDVAERLQMEMVNHDQWELEKGWKNGTIQP